MHRYKNTSFFNIFFRFLNEMNRKYRVNGINMSYMHQMCDCNSLDLSDLFLKCLSFRSENNFFLHGIGMNSVFNSIHLQNVAENHNVSYVFLDTCTWLPEKCHTTNMVTCKQVEATTIKRAMVRRQDGP